MTLHGVVYAGVEPNCLLLSQGGVSYLLLGGDPAALRDGSTVTVRGTVVKGVMTTCMQGVPFQVSEVRAG